MTHLTALPIQNMAPPAFYAEILVARTTSMAQSENIRNTKRIPLAPLDAQEALRRVMQVPTPERDPKPRQKKANRKIKMAVRKK